MCGGQRNVHDEKAEFYICYCNFGIGRCIGHGRSDLFSWYASGGYVAITNDEYHDYKQMKDKYGKLVELEQYIEKKYYVPVDEK